MKYTFRYEIPNGFLSGPEKIEFWVGYKGIDYRITITQLKNRIIEIFAEQSYYSDFLHIYYACLDLLQIFDGSFLNLVNANDGSTEVTQSIKRRELARYTSADFVQGVQNKLVCFSDAICERTFSRWLDIEEKLDITHKMFLIITSEIEMPVDMKCAFMTEIFLCVAELVNSENAQAFSLPQVTRADSKLQRYLIALISKYGMDIFGREISVGGNAEKLTGYLVNGRNRIAHIKTKQGKDYFDGPECVAYLMKLSLLYRVIVMDLLDISDDKYKERLKGRVASIDGMEAMNKVMRILSAN